jgi:hypothetical protein
MLAPRRGDGVDLLGGGPLESDGLRFRRSLQKVAVYLIQANPAALASAGTVNMNAAGISERRTRPRVSGGVGGQSSR